MKLSPDAFPSSLRHGAIYRPYLWHSGTLTVPAIPLYTPVNDAKRARYESKLNMLNLFRALVDRGKGAQRAKIIAVP